MIGGIMLRTLISTSDKTMWALRPQLYLIDKYWPQHGPIIVGGYTRPDFELPQGVTFHSLGKFEDYPVDRWTDGLIKLLDSISDPIIAFLMDDYWIFRNVDQMAVNLMTDYMLKHPEVARFDLTTDRLYAAGIVDYGRLGHLDLIKSDPRSPYNFSYQAALWRRESLRALLVEHETPWQSEMGGDGRLFESGALVLGTRQAPLRYTIAVQKGKFMPDGGYQLPRNAMNDSDLAYILAQKWIPDHVG
jgi:hypothetical protein